MYLVKKRFVAGILEGMEIVEKTSVKFEVGRRYQAIGGSDYIVDYVEEIGEE